MFLSMCFFLLGSCAVNKWQNTLIQKGDMNDAINKVTSVPLKLGRIKN